MKRILLTSTALVAFAGAAAAEITWSGDAKIGYNQDVENGVYYSAGLFVKASQELNGGLEAGFDLDIDLDVKPASGTAKQSSVTTSDYVLYLKSESAAMYFGDTKTAAETLFDAAGKTSIYGDYVMDNRFTRKSNVDGDKNGNNVNGVLRGDFAMNGWKVSASALSYKDAGTGRYSLGAGQAAAAGSFGDFNAGFAFQQADKKVVNESGKNIDGLFGLYFGGTFANIDATLGYVRNQTADTNSVLVKAAYSIQDVKVAAFFVSETGDKNNKYGIEAAYTAGAFDVKGQVMRDENAGNAYTQFKADGSYDLGNGLVLNAGGMTQSGSMDNRQAYIAGTYDLGNGGELLVSQGYDRNNKANDAIGDPEYNSGTTIQVSFKF